MKENLKYFLFSIRYYRTIRKALRSIKTEDMDSVLRNLQEVKTPTIKKVTFEDMEKFLNNNK